MAASLDANQQAADQVLIGQLNYKLPPTASYVIDRRAVSFFTNSAGTFSPTGVRTFRIQLNSDAAWADLNTLSLSFGIKNTGAANTALKCKTDGPWSLISRLRVYCSGTVVEDLMHYGRLHQTFYELSSDDMKKTEGMRGFLYRGRKGERWFKGKIPTGEVHTVSMRPLSGLLQCGRFFPIAWCPIVLEVELASADQAWMTGATANVGVGFLPTTSYEISDARVNCDLVTLDSGMHEEFARLMEGSGSLPLTISSFATFNQALFGSNPVVSITRAASRIRDIIWSFTRKNVAGNVPPDVPFFLGVNQNETISAVNDFMYPRRADTDGDQLKDTELYEAQWFLGAKILGPEQGVRYRHEYLNELYKALGYLNDTKALPDIDHERYFTETHIGAVTLERALNVANTGLSSRSGSLLSVQFKKLAPATPPAGLGAGDLAVDQVYITLIHEVALSLTKYGVVVAD